MPFWRWRCRWSPIDWAVRRQLLPGGIVLLLGYTIPAQRRALRVVDEAAEVCRKAASGNLEARILGDRQPGRLGTIQKSVNDMLDVTDAFVREASASMEYASHGKHFRKILVRGLPGSFRRSAATINSGTDSLGRRVVEIADLSKQFGTHLDGIAAASALPRPNWKPMPARWRRQRRRPAARPRA